MTHDEIIRMAGQAGLLNEHGEVRASWKRVEAFARLVEAACTPETVDAEWVARRTQYEVEAEREACAQLADTGKIDFAPPNIDAVTAYNTALNRYAESIRARGQK